MIQRQIMPMKMIAAILLFAKLTVCSGVCGEVLKANIENLYEHEISIGIPELNAELNKIKLPDGWESIRLGPLRLQWQPVSELQRRLLVTCSSDPSPSNLILYRIPVVQNIPAVVRDEVAVLVDASGLCQLSFNGTPVASWRVEILDLVDHVMVYTDTPNSPDVIASAVVGMPGAYVADSPLQRGQLIMSDASGGTTVFEAHRSLSLESLSGESEGPLNTGEVGEGVTVSRPEFFVCLVYNGFDQVLIPTAE